jgi:CspA family cold shock protein
VTAEVLWWNVDRGHGFVRNDEGEDIFLHHAAIVDDEKAGHRWKDEANLLPGQIVDFDPVAGTIGTVAANVRVVQG